MEKCIFGALFSTIVLTLIIGPFMLFSDIGGLTVENPVLNADIQVSFLLNKTVYINPDDFELITGLDKDDASEYNKAILNGTLGEDMYIQQSTPYKIYENKYPFIRSYSDEML